MSAAKLDRMTLWGAGINTELLVLIGGLVKVGVVILPRFSRSEVLLFCAGSVHCLTMLQHQNSRSCNLYGDWRISQDFFLCGP